MSKTWVLVADAARARLFEMPKRDSNLTEIACYTYPDSRSPGCHADYDRLPRSQESTNASRHAIEPKTPLREKHARQFAGTLGEIVRRGRLEGRYESLVLMAPPRFLGALHESLDEQTLKRVIGEVGSDLLKLSPGELRAHLPA